MSQIINSVKKQQGFSLVEMLISMVIFSIVMGIIYSYLLQTKEDITESQVEMSVADNAQTAINAIRKDLYQIGIGRDSADNQPQLLRAGMYDLIFCADADREVRNADDRYGCLNFDPLNILPREFDPIRFIRTSSLNHGFDFQREYGYQNIGAEIIRYSLDMNHDGVVTSRDLEDNVNLEDGRANTFNENDFWLNKEWFGCIKSPGGGIANSYSGIHPVAFNVRGMFYDPNGNMGAGILERFRYPTGDYPPPIFTYWGHFYNTITTIDNPEDEDWPGEPIELWGDWGGSRPMLNQPSAPDGNTGARDGVLANHEIAYMYNNRNYAQVNLAYLIGASGTVGEAEGQDLNGNGIPGETRLDQFIRRIGVTIVTESDLPNDKRPNLRRSNLSSSTNPVYYYYQDYEVSIQVNPRNLAYSGSPQIEMSQYTPTPVPPTPTPEPSTPTPDPTIPGTPTAAGSTTPTAVPTTPVGGYDPDNSEVVIGTERFIYFVTVDKEAFTPEDVITYMETVPYYLGPGQRAIDMEPANLCDDTGNFDEWNDLVVATDAIGGSPNLFYYKHEPSTSINGIGSDKSIKVGYDLQDRISSLTTGNIGEFGYVPSADYDEVVVAYHRAAGAASKTFIEVFYQNGQCGDLISGTGNLPLFDWPSQNRIKDMIIEDFDGDGLGELVILWDYVNSDNQNQVWYFWNLDDSSGDWGQRMEFRIDWGEDVQCAKLVAGVAQAGIPVPIQKDLVIVAENGDFRVFQNNRLNDPNWTPFSENPDDYHSPTLSGLRFADISSASIYNQAYEEDVTYMPGLMIVGRSNSDEFHQIAHYELIDYNAIYPKPNCSGAIFPYTPTVPPPATPSYPSVEPVDLAYAPVQFGAFTKDFFMLPTTFDSTDQYYTVLRSPCDYGDPSAPEVSAQLELPGMSDSFTCATTLRSSKSIYQSYMPTPTPGITPTPTP